MKNSRRGTKASKLSKRTRLAFKFFSIFFAIVGTFIAVAGVAVFAYINIQPEHVDPRTTVTWVGTEAPPPPDQEEARPNATSQPINDSQESKLFQAPKKTNFLVLGTDETELLTDVIIVGCFDSDTCELNLISIPRDTYVTLPQERIRNLREIGMHPPGSGVMKMNALHSYSGKKYGPMYVEAQLMDMLGVKFDYYIRVNLSAFRQIVDAVGGIEMEIPAGGLYYSDPVQDLLINVPGGLVHLDGEMAEGVVRYRATYQEGDLQRINMQHEFLKEFYRQVLSKETIINNAAGIANSIIGYVKTDFPITDIPKYIKYINDLSADKLQFYTLPGEAQFIGEASYFIYDPEATATLIDSIFRE